MKRQIKFRVRDSHTKKILGYEMFNTNHNAGFSFYYSDDKEEILHSEYSYPPMIKAETKFGNILREEFTGLIDRNGKEIFEGDVCKSLKGLFIIEYINAGFSLKSINKKCRNWAFTSHSAKSIEVIGNQFENPNLLQQ